MGEQQSRGGSDPSIQREGMGRGDSDHRWGNQSTVAVMCPNDDTPKAKHKDCIPCRDSAYSWDCPVHTHPPVES